MPGVGQYRQTAAIRSVLDAGLEDREKGVPVWCHGHPGSVLTQRRRQLLRVSRSDEFGASGAHRDRGGGGLQQDSAVDHTDLRTRVDRKDCW